MPSNSPQTILPLETFRQELGFSPYHFWRLANPVVPITDSCTPLVWEYAWQQKDAAGRAEIRKAISTVEQRLREHLNFDVGLKYNSTIIDLTDLALSNRGGYSRSAWGWGNPFYYGYPFLTLPVGKLSRISTVSYTLLGNAVVTFSDTDGDGLNDTFKATLADTTTDPALVSVTFANADKPAGCDSDVMDWQIRPVVVTRLDANTLQVCGPAWLLVKPSLYEGVRVPPGANVPYNGIDTSGALDPSNANNFVTSVALYKKVYTKDYTAYLIQEDGTNGAVETEIGAVIQNAEAGLVNVGLGDCSTACFNCLNYPGGRLSVRINYEAGDTLSKWQTVVTRYALAELRRAITACKEGNDEVYHWQADLSQIASGGTEGFRTPDEVLKCEFGTRRGAVDAWRAVLRNRLLRAVNS